MLVFRPFLQHPDLFPLHRHWMIRTNYIQSLYYLPFAAHFPEQLYMFSPDKGGINTNSTDFILKIIIRESDESLSFWDMLYSEWAVLQNTS